MGTATTPWGSYRDCIQEPGIVSRVLTINPGHRTSLHYHYQRLERWWIVSGKGVIEVDGEAYELAPGVSYVAAPGAVHCLRNRGWSRLVVLEVQTGVCVAADIVRCDDAYGRVSYEFYCQECDTAYIPEAFFNTPEVGMSLVRGNCFVCGKPVIRRDVRMPQVRDASGCITYSKGVGWQSLFSRAVNWLIRQIG